jgi:hypothetical protein
MVKCKLCNKEYKVITNTHLKRRHRITLKEYSKKFGSEGMGFLILPNNLPKNDLRYKKWRESLKNRPEPWNKGETKETHPSVAKISKTFKEKGVNNFKGWNKKRVNNINYNTPPKNGDTAELIGVIWGDGNIYQHKRTQGLKIASNSNNKGFIKRYCCLVEKTFNKVPSTYAFKKSYCTHIVLYEKKISERLGIPTGNRNNIKNRIPNWVNKNDGYIIRLLRGLYEAEGSFSVHKPTYTYKFEFSNKNDSLLSIVYNSLKRLGFHPHESKYKVQISRKSEVYTCKELIKFRKYD